MLMYDGCIYECSTTSKCICSDIFTKLMKVNSMINVKSHFGIFFLLLQLLRVQLRSLKAYLFTCSEHVANELRSLVWPREYLYDDVHKYSAMVG